MKQTNYEKYLKSEIQKDSSLKAGIDMAKGAVQIAQRVYNLRKDRKLTQKQLAKLIDIKQSNISRLESGDYSSYTYKTIQKVADALRARLNIELTPMEKAETVTSMHKLTNWITSIDFRLSLSSAVTDDVTKLSINHPSRAGNFNKLIWM